MKKSRFFSSVKIRYNVYAIFNRLMFNPVFVSYSEMKKIKSNDFSNFSRSDINLLIKRGIVVIDEKKMMKL